MKLFNFNYFQYFVLMAKGLLTVLLAAEIWRNKEFPVEATVMAAGLMGSPPLFPGVRFAAQLLSSSPTRQVLCLAKRVVGTFDSKWVGEIDFSPTT